VQSIQSKLFNGFLKFLNIKRIINKFVGKGKRRNRPFFSKREIEKHRISTVYIDQNEVSTMGKDLETPTNVLYFHGGMYLIEANSGHKKWLKKLYNHANCKITYVDYPLAPENTYNETIKMVVKTHQFLVNKYPNDNFILMGDSSGGGLALVLAQYLRDIQFENKPEKLILYSPWVILDMQNPDINQIVHKDLLLDVNELRKSARSYASGDDLSHKFLSPFYGSHQDLGEMHIFYGGDEILAPDISLLKMKCKEEDAQAAFYCYEGMQHVFQLFTFLPESKDVLRRTIEIVS